MKKDERNSDDNQQFSVRGIIREARGTKTQKEYAAELGIRQDLLCKYEKGAVNPPAPIVERCMRDAHRISKRRTPSAVTIARRIRSDLGEPELEPVRAIISNLLDVLSKTRKVGSLS